MTQEFLIAPFDEATKVKAHCAAASVLRVPSLQFSLLLFIYLFMQQASIQNLIYNGLDR